MISHNWSPMKRLIWLRGSGITGGAGTWSTISGNPVSFTAKAAPLRQLEVAFSPVQSLNGYDSPWPAGGGKNLLDISSCTPFDPPAAYGVNEMSIDSSGKVHIKGVGDGTHSSVSMAVFKASTENAQKIMGKGYVLTAWNISQTGGVFGSCWGFRTETENSFACSITELTNGTPFEFIFDPMVSDGRPTAYSPYSNLCPISGWSSLTVEQRGKNLWNADISSDGQNIDKLTYAGQASGYAVYSFPVPANTQMRVKAITLSSLTSAILIQSTKNGADYGNAVSISQLAWAHERVLTSNSDGVLYLLTNTSPQQTIQAATESEVEIEVGTQEIAAYVPYNPSSRSISISLGETVYSGWVDVISGVGEVDKAKYVFPSTENWTLFQTSFFYTGTILPYEGKKLDVIAENGIDCFINGKQVRVYIAGNADYIDSTTDMKSFMSGIGIVYELAEPIPISLTPQEVESLAGDNNLWSDANQPLTVTYRSN